MGIKNFFKPTELKKRIERKTKDPINKRKEFFRKCRLFIMEINMKMYIRRVSTINYQNGKD